MRNLPVLYLFIYKKIKEKADRRPCVTHSCVREVIRRKCYFIPNHLHIIILKEMEEMRLIRKFGTTNNIKYELVEKRVDKLINRHTFP